MERFLTVTVLAKTNRACFNIFPRLNCLDRVLLDLRCSQRVDLLPNCCLRTTIDELLSADNNCRIVVCGQQLDFIKSYFTKNKTKANNINLFL